MDDIERQILRMEARWAVAALIALAILVVVIVTTAIKLSAQPPGHVETIDPKRLQFSEFAEDNLGTTVAPDGAVTARIVATQFAFEPHCIAVPQGRPVTLRFATPDVVHGIEIEGTNVNTMIVPGYVSQLHVTFPKSGDLVMPCDEYCGLGHSEMWAVVHVIPPSKWHPAQPGRVSCAAQ